MSIKILIPKTTLKKGKRTITEKVAHTLDTQQEAILQIIKMHNKKTPIFIIENPLEQSRKTYNLVRKTYHITTEKLSSDATPVTS